MILGIDASSYFEEIDGGAKYYDNNIEVNPLELFKDNGVTYFRIRIWNNPFTIDGIPYKGGTCDLKYVIKLAKYVTCLGYQICLDFHYSDFWADPSKQFIPKEWANYSLGELKSAVYEYTKLVLNRLKSEGIEVPLVQIGNEITNGMLWPIGKLNGDIKTKRTGYDKLTELLYSGIKAAKEINENIKIILHLEKSGDQETYKEFFDAMNNYNINFDIIGMSYYPYWHGTLNNFFNNVEMLKERYKKDIMVMELAYGFTLEDYIKSDKNNLVINAESIKKLDFKMEYPISIDGQRDFIKDFIMLSIEHGIKGVFYWEPLLIPCNESYWASIEGMKYIHEMVKESRNEWGNECLFDYNGNKLEAFESFKV